MPKSKHRKIHQQRLNFRKTAIANQKRRVDKMFKQLSDELKSLPRSVPDMLNKEEESIITNNNEDFVVVDAPPFEEPVVINTPGIMS